jgi:hypothetical protein
MQFVIKINYGLVSQLFVGFCGFSLFFSFFFFFLFARVWFPLYTSCMLRGTLRFFNIILCLPIKKKKKAIYERETFMVLNLKRRKI